MLHGGETFTGGIYFETSGDAGAPIVITSYGTGRATIQAAVNTSGIYGYQVEYVRISDIHLVGVGAGSNNCYRDAKGAGIFFYAGELANPNSGDGKYRGIEIVDVEVEQFESGITIGSWETNLYGYDGVLVERAVAHGNRDAGISTWGMWTTSLVGYSHKNVVIRNCTTYENHGNPCSSSHSGSGIVVGNVENVLIEYCLSYQVMMWHMRRRERERE